MFFERVNAHTGQYHLVGTEDEFRALRNVVLAARATDRLLSSSERQAIDDVQKDVLKEILGDRKKDEEE